MKLDFQFNQSESKPLFAHHVISKTGDQIFATAHLDVENNIVGEPLVRLHFERIDKQKLQPYFFANDVLWYDANEFNLPIPTVIIHPTASVTENGIEARYTQQLVAYPNPVYNTLSIQALGIQDYTTLDVYDLAGNIVLHNSIVPKAGQVEQLNIEHLTPGMYTVRARSGVKSAFCRIIKQ